MSWAKMFRLFEPSWWQHHAGFNDYVIAVAVATSLIVLLRSAWRRWWIRRRLRQAGLVKEVEGIVQYPSWSFKRRWARGWLRRVGLTVTFPVGFSEEKAATARYLLENTFNMTLAEPERSTENRCRYYFKKLSFDEPSFFFGLVTRLTRKS